MTASIVRRVEVGNGYGFEVWTRRGAAAGPRVVVLGGVHGDETEGALAAGRLAVDHLELTRGVLEVVPICHEAAFNADSRTSPLDGENLARVFPGDPKGTATHRLAHLLFTEVLSGCDLLIDMHTSGQSYQMPVLAGYRGETQDARSLARQAAEAFGGEFLWRHPQPSQGRTVSVVDQAIYVESPGGGPTDPAQVESYMAGVTRVLALLGMVTDAPPLNKAPIRVTGGGNLDRDMISVSHSGLFLHGVAHGDLVTEGQTLGTVVDPKGRPHEEVFAPRTGHVMALKSRSSVTAGDLVVCLAELDG